MPSVMLYAHCDSVYFLMCSLSHDAVVRRNWAGWSGFCQTTFLG